MEEGVRSMNEVGQSGPSKERMLSINNLPGGVGVYELGDEIIATYLSRGLSKLLAYTPKEFHNYNELDLLDSVHERERKRIKAVFQKLKSSHKEMDVSFRLQRKEDRFIRLLGRYSRHHGQFPVYYLVASDVSEAHQNALALERQNTRLQFAFSHSTLEMWEYHLDEDRLVALSRTVLGGHAPLEIHNPAAFLLEEGYIHPDFSVTLNHDFAQLQAGKEPDSILSVRSAAGSFRWLRLSYAFLSDGEEEHRRAIGIFQDVHDEIAMRLQALGQDKAFFGGFNLDSGTPVLADNRVWKMMDGCDDFYTMYDSVLQAAIQKEYLPVFHEIDTSEKLKHFVESGKKELTIEAKMIHPFHKEDGYRWVRFHFNVSVANNTTIGYIAIKDIEASKVQEQALEKRAHSDSLTGVYNRFSLEELVTRYLRNGGNSVFFLIDIDRFKLINDTYGHDLGDRVLKRIAFLMRNVFPKGTIIGRLGGDEFVAYVPHFTEALLRAGDKFCRLIAEDRTLGILVTCSLGYCISPEDGITFNELYQHADLALYHSKNHGRNQCTHYVSEMGMHKTLCWTNHEWMLDNLPDTVYLCDMQSYDLLFLNKAGREAHSPDANYIGKKCYEVIFHRDQVCEHCRFHSLSYDSYSFWQQVDEYGSVWLCKEKLILFNEKPAKLAILVDQLKQAKQIAEKSATQPTKLHLSRSSYFKLLQRGDSSWDYDVNHDILSLFVFIDGQPYVEQVHGFLKSNASIKAMLAEDRPLFREALRKRIAEPEGSPIQVRLTLSSGSFIPVLISWYYMPHRIGGNVVRFSPSGYISPESPLKEILQNFTVALLHLAWERDTLTLLLANRKFHEMFNSEETTLEKDPLGWLLPSERNNVFARMRNLQENHQRGETFMVVGHDNRYFSLTCQLGTCYGYVQIVTFTLQDVSREHKLQQLNKRMLPYIEQSKEGIAVFSLESYSLELQYANETLAALLGYAREDLITQLKNNAMQLFYPEDRTLLLRHVERQSMTSTPSTPFNLRLVKKDGEIIWSRITFRQMGIQGRGEPFSLLIEDLSESMHDEEVLQQVQEQLSFALNHNLVTGLYTRQRFYEVCRDFLDTHINTTFVMVYWNIERFSVLNELLGFDRGNQVLQLVARSLRDFIKDHGVYGHVGADHFAACIPKEMSSASKLKQAIDIEHIGQEIGLHLSMVFGMHEIEDSSQGIPSLLDKAHSASKISRFRNREGYAFYEPSIRSDTFNEQDVLNEMQGALDGGQFTFFLQPIYDIQGMHIHSAEALSRWVHPTRGVIPPKQFIPVFEKYGFITALDMSVLSSVCAFIAEQKIDIPISINLSRIDVNNKNIVKLILQTTESYAVDHSYIQFEITESAYIDNPVQMSELVSELKSHGFTILMDDFGSGYSSLHMLSTLPMDIIKVDRSFIYEIGENNRSKAVLSSIIQMGKELGMDMVVEGVENEDHHEFLSEAGALFGQGFYYQQPMEREAFFKLLIHG